MVCNLTEPLIHLTFSGQFCVLRIHLLLAHFFPFIMKTNFLSFRNLKSDLPSGLVVFLVALPLCLGISLASGAPFFSGLISGIIGGVVIGSLSGSKLSVSGPAAGLAALVLASITNIGAFDLFLCSVVIAGILQVIMSLARLGGHRQLFSFKCHQRHADKHRYTHYCQANTTCRRI